LVRKARLGENCRTKLSWLLKTGYLRGIENGQSRRRGGKLDWWQSNINYTVLHWRDRGTSARLGRIIIVILNLRICIVMTTYFELDRIILENSGTKN